MTERLLAYVQYLMLAGISHPRLDRVEAYLIQRMNRG